MSKNRLEYAKTVLHKVSFDIKLFKKELLKAYQYLIEDDVEKLMTWVVKNYGTNYCLQPIYIKK